MLVTFGDLTDPTSLERVEPDDLAASFGNSVRLKRITTQLTDEPVKAGLKARLKWLQATRGALIQTAPSEYPPPGTPLPFAAEVTNLDFQRAS